MRIYFYHTQNIQYLLEQHALGRCPAHFLYGATHLADHGIEVVWHRFIPSLSRIHRMVVTCWRIWHQRKHIDAVYATHYTGLELLIFLRTFGLFHHPIVLWHHQPVVHSSSWMREQLGKLFYRGMDGLIFFSQKLIDDSLATGKVPAYKLHLGYWGADLDFYDRLSATQPTRHGFVSTGKELRDMPTLVEAFNRTGAPLDIYHNHNSAHVNYEETFSRLHVAPNIHVHYNDHFALSELFEAANHAGCIVICCHESRYTVGLTTVVEALALGIPMICSRNPQIPIDIDGEGCGITVPYYDVEGWVAAIQYIEKHPDKAAEMGHKGRLLAERLFNDKRCGTLVAELLHAVVDAPATRL